ncbi:MAG TPA: ABC transporter ATP-binding protein [Solirubrobacteraceae bacterium]|nr:ABC transporter ATP-binding protein [Solirubrobacteraceae bacterium]
MSELLCMSGVDKSFRRGSQDLRVLKDASLEVGVGEVVCVLGTRGQGKTTLLRIAAGMESADSGEVRFRGEDLTGLSDRKLSRLLGGQIAWAGRSGPGGMRMRLLDYVAMPLLAGHSRARKRGREDVYARARAALERVGAQGCGEQRWEGISDWERALVELAQGIVGEPELLLVDDLTDALGIRETDELTALIRSLSKELGLGVLMSVSDPQATLFSDRIMTLGGGTLTAGPSQEPGNVIEFPDLGAGRREAERGRRGS